jgi:hypothetical protein
VNVVDRSLAEACCGKDKNAKGKGNDGAKERENEAEHVLHLPDPNRSAIWLWLKVMPL